MKKHLVILMCLFATALPVVPIWGQENSITLNNNLRAGISNEFSYMLEQSNQIDIISNYQANMINEAISKINSLDKSDKMEWFKQYKKIQEEYKDWIDVDETIYDYYDLSELELLFKIVETEVRGEGNFDEKANVASVIFNRIEHEDFPITLTEVLTEYPQFSSYISGEYKNVDVTETTILACEYAFQIEDTTDGALYFDSTNGNSWAKRNKNYIFTDSVGHDFYK